MSPVWRREPASGHRGSPRFDPDTDGSHAGSQRPPQTPTFSSVTRSRMSGVVHHRPADLATLLGAGNPFQPYPRSSRSVVSIRVSRINSALCAVIPCLQSPPEVFSMFAGLGMQRSERLSKSSVAHARWCRLWVSARPRMISSVGTSSVTVRQGRLRSSGRSAGRWWPASAALVAVFQFCTGWVARPPSAVLK
jgi:hypothetical protein